MIFYNDYFNANQVQLINAYWVVCDLIGNRWIEIAYVKLYWKEIIIYHLPLRVDIFIWCHVGYGRKSPFSTFWSLFFFLQWNNKDTWLWQFYCLSWWNKLCAHFLPITHIACSYNNMCIFLPAWQYTTGACTLQKENIDCMIVWPFIVFAFSANWKAWVRTVPSGKKQGENKKLNKSFWRGRRLCDLFQRNPLAINCPCSPFSNPLSSSVSILAGKSQWFLHKYVITPIWTHTYSHTHTHTHSQSTSIHTHTPVHTHTHSHAFS